MDLYSVNTVYFKLDGGAMFGVVPKSSLPRAMLVPYGNLQRRGFKTPLIKTKNPPSEGREVV